MANPVVESTDYFIAKEKLYNLMFWLVSKKSSKLRAPNEIFKVFSNKLIVFM